MYEENNNNSNSENTEINLFEVGKSLLNINASIIL